MSNIIKRNSTAPFKLKHQSKAALHSNHHDFDPRNRQIYESMPQHVKDSLHTEANKYGKSFWSDQHQVNVDPEDGVLSNRPRVKGTDKYFKMKAINKPYSEYEAQFDTPEFKEFVAREKAAYGDGDEFGRMYAVVNPDGSYRLKDLSGFMEHIDIPEGMSYPESEQYLREQAKMALKDQENMNLSDKIFMSNY